MQSCMAVSTPEAILHSHKSSRHPLLPASFLCSTLALVSNTCLLFVLQLPCRTASDTYLTQLLRFALQSIAAHLTRDPYHLSQHKTFIYSAQFIFLARIGHLQRSVVLSQNCGSVEPYPLNMPSTRRVKVLAAALAVAVCTILYLSVRRLALPRLEFVYYVGMQCLLIYMLTCPERLVIPRLLQPHSCRP